MKRKEVVARPNVNVLAFNFPQIKPLFENFLCRRRKPMLKNRLMLVLSLLVVASMILTACGTPATATEPPATTAPTEAPTVAPTEAAPTAEPTPVPTTRHGGWLDEIAFSSVASDSAV